MTPAWAQRQEALGGTASFLPTCSAPWWTVWVHSSCPISRLSEAEAGQHHVHRYLAGLLSHLHRKNAETIAALVDVGDRSSKLHGTAPWDHQPLIHVLVRLRMLMPPSRTRETCQRDNIAPSWLARNYSI